VAVCCGQWLEQWHLYTSGIFDMQCVKPLDHSVLVVGYGAQDGKDFWKIKNSWGTGWGEGGYIRFAKGEAVKEKEGQCGLLTMPAFVSKVRIVGKKPGVDDAAALGRRGGAGEAVLWVEGDNAEVAFA
jgi:hypothetical protein